MSWREANLDDPEERQLAIALASDISSASPDAGLYHDLRWLLGDERNKVRALFFEQDDARGFLPLLVQDRPLPLMVGEVTFWRFPLTRLTVQGGPLLDCADERREDLLAQLIRFFVDTMPPATGLHVEGIPVDGPFLGALERAAVPGGGARMLRLCQPFMRQFIDMPASYDEYLAQMSKRSRKSVQYSRRKLEKEFDGKVEARRFDSAEMVDAFVTDARIVSRQTYQWHLLGLGLRDPVQLADTLGVAARLGIFRSYLLYCGAEPVAFMLGYLYRGTYYYIDVGYATTWRDWSVGSVLQLLVLEDLYADSTPPRRFDFSTGYGEHKGRFGNVEQEQVNILLMRRTLRSGVAFRAFRSVDAAASAAVGALDRLGLKQRIKRAIRRGSVTSGAGDDATP